MVFTGSWNGDPATLHLTEGVKLEFHQVDALAQMRVPPWVTQALHRLRDQGVLPEPPPGLTASTAPAR